MKIAAELLIDGECSVFAIRLCEPVTDEKTTTMLLLSLDYPPNDGGISRLAAELTKALLESNSALRVVTLKSTETGGLKRPNVECHEVSRKRGVREWQIFRALRGYGRAAPILTTLWNPEATIAIIAGWRRVSILAHGNEVMPYLDKPLKQRLRRYVFEKAHVVICNSHFTEGLVRQIAPRATTAVVNPAVDAEAFTSHLSREAARSFLGLPTEVNILLTVSRLDPIKGHETVLRSVAKLLPDERANTLYVIVGKGEQMDPLKEMARDLGISANIHFAGFVADADLSAYYAAADLFVLCSFIDDTSRSVEGFGMVFTEAQAAGLAVIGTRSGGIPDAVVEGEGGWLVDERDASALSDHLRALHHDPKRVRREGEQGAVRVRRDMTWKKYAERILELI
jgi:phosphatidylinositol alpha-1,6-mannosyltransferase